MVARTKRDLRLVYVNLWIGEYGIINSKNPPREYLSFGPQEQC